MNDNYTIYAIARRKHFLWFSWVEYLAKHGKMPTRKFNHNLCVWDEDCDVAAKIANALARGYFVKAISANDRDQEISQYQQELTNKKKPEEFEAWVNTLPQWTPNISLPDDAFDRENIYRDRE